MNRLPISFYFQILLCAGLWGSAFPVIKLSYQSLALESYGEQLLFAGTRFVLAGLLVMCFCRRSIWRSARNAPKSKLLLVILGQTYFQYVFFYYALGVSSGTLGALLVGAGSLSWVLLAPVFLDSPYPSRKQWIILLCCTFGIGLAVYASGAGAGNVVMGTVGFLLASLSGAFGAIGLKQVSKNSGTRSITSISLFVGGLLLIVTGSFAWDDFWSHYSLTTFGITFYLAILSATAFTVWNRLIENYSVNLLSAYRFMIPLCGVIESAIFIKAETVGPGIMIGGSIVILSLFAMSRLKVETLDIKAP